MYKIELGGGCFKHDMEQTIILWFSSKSEFSSLNDLWKAILGGMVCRVPY